MKEQWGDDGTVEIMREQKKKKKRKWNNKWTGNDETSYVKHHKNTRTFDTKIENDTFFAEGNLLEFA